MWICVALLSRLIILWTTAVLLTDGAGIPSNAGTTFLAGFMENGSPVNPEFHIVSDTSSDVIVQIEFPPSSGLTTISAVVARDNVTVVSLPSEVRMSAGNIEDKGIFINASGDITVYGYNKGNGSTDGFILFPVKVTGNDYYVITYTPSSQSISQMAIIARHNTTTVTIKLRSDGASIKLSQGGKEYKNGDTINIVLNARQTLCLESETDLTGVHVMASQAITVMSGSRRLVFNSSSSSTASVATTTQSSQTSVTWTDTLTMMLPPSNRWDKTFFAVPFSDGSGGDVFIILAQTSDTHVQVKKSQKAFTYTLAAGKHQEISVPRDETLYIQSDKPVLVAQILLGDSSGGAICDSYMSLVPGIAQQRALYRFSSLYTTNLYNLQVIINSVYKNGLQMDGQTIASANSWKDVSVMDISQNFSVLQLSASTGYHNITHSDSNVTFYVIAYGYPVGMDMTDTSAAPSYQSQTADATDGHGQYSQTTDDSISPNVIAVIVSLTSAILFVGLCIAGFLIAEVVCKRDEMRTSKVMPING